jgi:serine/threonine protein kinase
MNSQRRQRIKQLFDEAVDLEIHERAAFLEEECAGDETLRKEVELLLASDEEASDLTHENAVRAVAQDKSQQAVLAIGELIDGRYHIKRELDRGGLSVVYLARDRLLDDKKVAIKVLRREVLQNEEVLRKFKHEMEALARIEHEGVVGILNSGETPDGISYIVMQYVAGVSLARLTTAQGMELGRVARIVKGIGEALDAAHRAGVLHRDLKPSNIMISATPKGEEVKLIDFGIAKVIKPRIAESTLAPLFMGTCEYMSPEQLEGAHVSSASDIYAFGVIAYELVTGQRPFIFKTEYQLLEMQRAGVRIRPRDLCPSLSHAAQELILKALQFEPRNRPHNAREFGDALAQALTGGEHDLSQSNDAVQAIDLAHVLCAGIYGHSSLTVGEQMSSVRELQEIVRSVPEFARGQGDRQLLPQSTSDGMTLAFFGDPQAPVRCALQIGEALKQRAAFETRMGIHSGPVNKLTGGNGRSSVTGHVVDVARRIMECGGARHILLSKRVADDISLLSTFRESLQEIGEIELERGVRMRVVNLYTGEVGNPAKPEGCRKRLQLSRALLATVAAAFLLIILTGLASWIFWSNPLSNNPTTNVESEASPTPGQTKPTPTPSPINIKRPRGPWDAPRAPFKTLTAKYKLYEVALSPDGRRLASSGGGGEVRLWQIGEQGGQELRGATQAGRSVALSPGGDLVASGNDDGTIRLWSSVDGSPLKSLVGHTKYVFLVAFSPDGQTLVSAGNDKTIRVWRVGDGKMLNSLTLPKPEILVINVSPDQQTAALYNSRERSVQLWSLTDNRLLTFLEKQTHDIKCGVFSPDGQVLALGSSDGVVRLWNVADGRLLRELTDSAGRGVVNAIAYSQDGRTLACGLSNGTIRLWNVDDGRLLMPLVGQKTAVQSLSFDASGQVLASASDDRRIRLWHVGDE